MPSVSDKQARTMQAAAHDKSFAEKVGIPQSVARHYVQADEAKAHHKPAAESVTAQPMSQVTTSGYVHPSGPAPFKIF